MKRAWLLALLVGCSESGAKSVDGPRDVAPDNGHNDAGADATLADSGAADAAAPLGDGSTDAARDVALDVPRDAAPDVAVCQDALLDAGAVDAGDGGFPYGGTWIPIEGLPADCSQRVAINPAASIPPITWRPCTCGRTGCAAFRVGWSANAGRKLFVNERDPVFFQGKPYFSFDRMHPAGSDYSAYVTTLESLDGDVKFALGSRHPTTPQCVRSIGFGSGGVAAHVHYGNPPTRQGWLAWSSWSSPTSFTLAPMSEQVLGGTALRLENNAGHLYLEVHDSHETVSVFDTVSKTVHPTSSDPAFVAGLPNEVADGAIFIGGYDPYSLYLAKPDASIVLLVAPSAPTRTVRDWRLDRGVANAIAWVDAANTQPYRSDYYLWTSPYAATASGIQSRKVAKIPDAALQRGSQFALYKGHALFVVDKDSALLVRLSDGKGWPIATEPGHELVGPLWVDDDYVWFVTESTKGAVDSMLRIARSTLGAPTVPNGLPDAGP
jgi:hypothetical protein